VIASPAISPIRILLSTAGVYRRTEVGTEGHTAGPTPQRRPFRTDTSRLERHSGATVPELPAREPGPAGDDAGLVAILLSVIPVYLATRLSGGVVGARG
jgi:hypothetical protein